MKTILLASTFLVMLTLSDEDRLISMDDYLKSSYSDYSLIVNEKTDNYIQHAKFRVALLEDVQVRTQTDEFDLFQPQYGIRLHPMAPMKIKRSNQIGVNTRYREYVEKELLVHQALKERYLIIVNYYFCQKKKELLTKKLTHTKNKLAFYKTQSENFSDFDIDDFIKAKEEHMAVLKSLLETGNALDLLEKKMMNHLNTTDKMSFSFGKFVTLPIIDSICNTEFKSTIIDHPGMKAARADMALSESDYRFERAQSSISLDFLQIAYLYNYNNKKNYDIRKNIKLGVGIAFPLHSANRVNLNDKMIRTLEVEKSYKLLEATLVESSENYRHEIKGLIQFTDSSLMTQMPSMKKIKSIPGVEPGTLLKIESIELNEEEFLLDIYQSIVLKYIEMLDTSGKLSIHPLRNYLSGSLTYLE